MLLTTIILFLVILGVLVFVHEFGHFIMAKRSGAKVEEFGFGFPPRIFGVKRGETIYSINLIPLGGFVKILGENGEEKENSRSFSSKTIWQRFQMLAAGVTANIVLAVVLFSIVAAIGVPTIFGSADDEKNVKNLQVMILEVKDNSPAKNADIKAGDFIVSLAVDSQKTDIKKVKDVETFIDQNRGRDITFTVKRGQELLNLKAHARTDAPEGEGATGISLGAVGVVSYPWYEAIWQGITRTWDVASLILVTLFGLIKSLVTSGRVSEQLTGPVGIAAMVGQTAQLGVAYVLQFTALLSVNLAIINALPFPALDGGRILFLVIEKIKKKPVSQETENLIHTIGFSLLILFMVLVTFKDFKTYDVWQRVKNLF